MKFGQLLCKRKNKLNNPNLLPTCVFDKELWLTPICLMQGWQTQKTAEEMEPDAKERWDLLQTRDSNINCKNTVLGMGKETRHEFKSAS